VKALEIKDLDKHFDSFKAVNGLNLVVEESEIHGFLGPNGAGKTTTLRMIMGLLEPDDGDILIYGKNNDSKDLDVLSRIGYMPERPSFPVHLTSRELLEIYGQTYGIPEEVREARASRLLNKVGLDNYADKRTGKFSKGMKQRLGIAQALISEPDLLVLDEPTAGLDPGGRARMRQIIKEIGKDDITMLISSHLLEEVEKICETVTMIDEGKSVLSGSVEELSHSKTVLQIELMEITSRIINALEDLPKVKEVIRVDDDKEEIKVIASDDEDYRPVVSKTIVDHGGTILKMTDRSRSLEDVYLEVIDGGPEDEQLR